MKDRGVREGDNSGWEELGTKDKGIWSTFLLSCSLLPEYPLFSCSCFGVALLKEIPPLSMGWPQADPGGIFLN